MVKRKSNVHKEVRWEIVGLFVLLVLSSLLCWGVNQLLPFRLSLLFHILGLAGAVALFIPGIRLTGHTGSLWFLPLGVGSGMGFGCFCRLLLSSFDYTYCAKPLLPFWEMSVVIVLVAGVIVTVMWLWKRRSGGTKMAGFLTVMVVTAVLIIFCVPHANYLLDFQPPVERQAVIEDKKITHNGKAYRDYGFQVTVDGETFDLDVDRKEYQSYEVGDTYTFYKYKGAFGKPFYLAED